MQFRRRGSERVTAHEPREEVVIDLRERLAPYEMDDVGYPDWRQALVEADERRRGRSLRRKPARR